jgi:N-carbamoyl-L-amino-acid hydrolase
MHVSPNAPNVIPGRVEMTIELRDLSTDKLDKIGAEIRARGAQIAKDTRTTVNIGPLSRNPPALASSDMQEIIERSAKSLGLASMRMPSGAGHDAQMMAQLSPMGMIFVPSIGGISHSPKELTTWEDCARGANVLLGAVLALDRA